MLHVRRSRLSLRLDMNATQEATSSNTESYHDFTSTLPETYMSGRRQSYEQNQKDVGDNQHFFPANFLGWGLRHEHADLR